MRIEYNPRKFLLLVPLPMLRQYFDGRGVPKDGDDGAALLRDAAEQGLAEAQTSLAARYDTGDGVPENAVLAAFWYERAAQQGFAVAQHNLGILKRDGRGVLRHRSRR